MKTTRSMLKNQTKVFVATVSSYEYENILGVSSTYEGALARFDGLQISTIESRNVYEMPLDSPFNFDAADPKHGYRILT